MAIPIRSLLAESVQRTGASKQINAAVICNEFDKLLVEILGDKVKDKAQAKYIKNGTLTVAVLSSIMGQEIKLHELELLEKLSKKVGQNKVDRLRFLV